MDKDDLILVTGAGGFIGGHLVKDLIQQGFKRIRAIDIKPFKEWYQRSKEIESTQADLKDHAACERACRDVRWVFNLAADMGGMGFIETNKAECMLSVHINTHLLLAAKKFGVERYFFSSTACVYAANKQYATSLPALKEEDAYPAQAEDGYRWEKLFSERLPPRRLWFRNAYGPLSQRLWPPWDL
jgi:nucleoside-diphosphate-sugar epimerase